MDVPTYPSAPNPPLEIIIPPTSLELAAGLKIFERFTLISQIGEGRCSTIWLAEDPRFRRKVALKIFFPANREQPFVEQKIWRELLRRLRILNHSNISLSMEFLVDDPWVAVSNEFVEGKTLAEVAFQNSVKMPATTMSAILADIGHALAAAHEQSKIVHGNLNAYNILIALRDNAPKITDFGFHPPIGLHSQANSSELAWKTACLSTARSQGAAPSIEDDIYAFCVVAFQLFTGKNPPKAREGDFDSSEGEKFLSAAPEAWRSGLLDNLSTDPAKHSPSVEALLHAVGVSKTLPTVELQSLQPRTPRSANSKKRRDQRREEKARHGWLMRFVTVLCAISLPVLLGWMIYQNIQATHHMEMARADEDVVTRAAEAVQKQKLTDLAASLDGNRGAFAINIGPTPKAVPVLDAAPIPTAEPKPLEVNSGARDIYEEGKKKIAAGDISGALESYGLAMVLQPDWPELREANAEALLAEGEAEAAVKEFTATLKFESGRVSSLLGRAKAWLAFGKNAEAKNDFEAVLKIDPNQAEAKAALEKL